MDKAPEQAEVDVFRTFVEKLTSIQQQLDSRYHCDHFLRDRLLTAVDLLTMQSALCDRIPRTAQKVINRMAAKLSDKSKTAGTSTSAHYTNADRVDDANQALYKLGQK